MVVVGSALLRSKLIPMGQEEGEKEELRSYNAMSIEGPFANERERLSGDFTAADRAYRRQYLKDQELAPDEPQVVPELEQAFKNPIRRFYRKPMDMLQVALRPIVGEAWAARFRYHIPKHLIGISFVYLTWYYFKYNANDWTRKGGWKVRSVRPICVKGDPGYPKVSERSEPGDYYDRGFKSRKIALD